MDLGLLIIRIVVGLLVAGHGSQKLFGAFGGHGIAGTSGFFQSQGFRPGKAMAVVAGVTELAGGLMLALGLLTPLASAMIVGTLVVAASVHAGNGIWGQNGGYELPLLYVVTAGAIAFTGPGEVSLDYVLGVPADPWLATAAVFLGLAGALVVVARAKALVRTDERAKELATSRA